MVVSALLAGPAAAVPAPAVEPIGHVGQAGQGYGELLWMSLGLLVAIGVIAVVAVRLFGGGRLLRRGSGSGLMEVIARQPLEPRRSLYVVRVGQRRLVVGTSELGVTMLTELEAAPAAASEASEDKAASPPSFAELVRDAARQWTGRRRRQARSAPEREAARAEAGRGGEQAAAIAEERLPS